MREHGLPEQPRPTRRGALALPVASWPDGERPRPLAVDEHGEMKQEVYNLAAYAIEQYVTEMEVSKHIKAHFDQKYGPTWHCIVGSDFRAYVTHESKNFIFFYQGKTAICLYKCG